MFRKVAGVIQGQGHSWGSRGFSMRCRGDEDDLRRSGSFGDFQLVFGAFLGVMIVSGTLKECFVEVS